MSITSEPLIRSFWNLVFGTKPDSIGKQFSLLAGKTQKFNVKKLRSIKFKLMIYEKTKVGILKDFVWHLKATLNFILNLVDSF